MKWATRAAERDIVYWTGINAFDLLAVGDACSGRHGRCYHGDESEGEVRIYDFGGNRLLNRRL